VIAFAAEPLTRQLPTCAEQRWPSVCGRWAILEIATDYGRRPRKEKILLVRCLTVGEYVVGRFRCRRHAIRKARELDV